MAFMFLLVAFSQVYFYSPCSRFDSHSPDSSASSLQPSISFTLENFLFNFSIWLRLLELLAVHEEQRAVET